MTTSLTLASLKEALQHPFAPDVIQFLPKDIHQEQGRVVCLALPYANKRVYEDRLNELVFGEWSSPYTPPYAQGNKLIIPATVVILGVAHTDYGEAFLETTSKSGTTREEENTATEAYSQAFRRTCAKFLLGRYLYDLPRLTLPYDPQTKRITVSKAERIAWVEKLYMEAGLNPRSSSTSQRPVHATARPQPHADPTASQAAVQQQSATATAPAKGAPVQPKPATPSAPQPQPGATASVSQPRMKETQPIPQPTSYPNDTFLDWVASQVQRDPMRLQDMCDFYQIAALPQLSEAQRKDVTRRLRQQARQQRHHPHAEPSAHASL